MSYLILLFSGLSVISVSFSQNSTRYTNVKCIVMSPSYVIFKQCHLKVLGRGLIALTIQAVLLKDPITNAKVNLALFRKYNGFQPYLLKATFDFCKIVSKSNYRFSVEKIFIDAILPFSNINHSCPYKDEIYIKNIVFKEEFLKFIPLPSGEYQIQLFTFSDNILRAKVYVNFERKEQLM
ncbi:hypothetical protein KR093_009112 [Drosophila rubida]|uniref:MD-2-related lipid-recognition domain-containing protein n=1 Tax=Drosophila rubida TaxID=30044 RepID=A0AAD4PKM0_9MUSC|nr:hypothetical protein KR093_009112 [Drosophila rubida]